VTAFTTIKPLGREIMKTNDKRRARRLGGGDDKVKVNSAVLALIAVIVDGVPQL
jgi:hypothetical protein